MRKLFLFLCLFHFSFGNETEYKTLYEIDLPNDENDPNHIKSVIISQINNSDNYTLNIIYKSEESFNNSFILNSENLFEIIKCIILQNEDCDWRGSLDSRNMYLKYYDNGVFSLCVYKRYYKKREIFHRSLCLDRSEYKRFMNVISFIFNKINNE